MISEAQKQAIRDRHPVDAVAGETVTLRRQRGKYTHVGPCPICSEDPCSKTAARFECSADTWLCAVCQDGGDVIALVMKRDGVDFRQAIDRLGGAGEVEITPRMAEMAGRRAYEGAEIKTAAPAAVPADYDTLTLKGHWRDGWITAARRAGYASMARERERKRLLNFCLGALPAHQAEGLRRYFSARGLTTAPPRGCRLGWHPAMPYFADGREHEPLLIHTGPAMLAPISDAERRFTGLHITWLDPAQPKGKARILHPDTGKVLPSKKVRGHKAGGYIDLGGDLDATRMIAGEGIETVLAAYTDLMRTGRDITHTCFRSGIDLGNLAGRATGTVAHETLKAANGRAQRVPVPSALLSSPAMPVPETITHLVLLGDGDSDPFLTRHALTRAAERHARDGRKVAVVWPDHVKAGND